MHLDDQDHFLTAGSFAYEPSDNLHQFKNTGKDRFAFICIVHEEGDK
ncbi:MAG: cupin domain-containing protein [Desulfosporosinus sp.]|nr:cupin domain-containing protein [Desulfosporosinus sp.]